MLSFSILLAVGPAAWAEASAYINKTSAYWYKGKLKVAIVAVGLLYFFGDRINTPCCGNSGWPEKDWL